VGERERCAAFLEHYLGWAAPLERARNLAWWNAALGDVAASAQLATLDREWAERHADQEAFVRLGRWRTQAERWPALLRRQVQLAYLAYAAEQRDPATLDEELRLERTLRDTFNAFRATLDGQQVDDNTLDRILQESTDSAQVQAAWEASKQIGAVVAPDLRALARLRNQSARRTGYPTYWHRMLALREIDPERLSTLLEEIDQATRPPFTRVKAALDQRLAQRFGLDVPALRPWHYQDPYFQRAPALDADPLDQLARDMDLIAVGIRSYDGLGIDLRPVIARSDLFPRPGKSQHAFCTHIDRAGDVRVLLNLLPSGRWLRTLLHELGHAAYEDRLSPTLPYLLRDGAHPLVHEGLAMLMEELTADRAWLRRVAGLAPREAESVQAQLLEQKRLDRLVFIRWCLSIVRFERALYQNPDADLDSLWWQEVQRSQMLTPPEGRHAPDWAAKIHLAQAPVYYQSYFLGSLFAAQMGRAVRQASGGRFAESRAAGRFLVKRLFRQGARRGWEETVCYATGASLGAEAFAAAVA